MRISRAEQGKLLFKKTDTADKFYILLAGEVQAVKVNRQENEVIMNVLGPGRSFGERALIRNETRSLGIR